MFEEAEDLLTVPEACALLRMGRGAFIRCWPADN